MDAPVIQNALETIGAGAVLRHEDGRTLNGVDLEGRVAAAAAAMAAHGPEAGDVVALTGLSREDTVVALLASIDAGLVAWPLSDRAPPRAVARQLATSGARLIISETTSQVASHVEGAERWSIPGAATLVATSGTTGGPKLAVHTLENHLSSARSAARATRFGKGDTWLLSLALHHIGGLGIVFRALATKGCVLLPERGGGLERGICTHHPSHVSVVATQLSRLLDDPACVEALRGCRTVLLGGGPIPEGLRRDALEHGIPIMVSYGATETTALVTAGRDPRMVLMPQSAGGTLRDRDVRIRDDGEIAVGGPGIFQGYLATDGVDDVRDDDGFFATGDLGHLDDSGVLFVRGRKDRRFVSGGENIQPEEIEIALESLFGVEQAMVVPVPNQTYGERPVAFVHLDPGAAVEIADLSPALRSRLPGFKVPDRILPLPAEMRAWPKPDYEELARLARASPT